MNRKAVKPCTVEAVPCTLFELSSTSRLSSLVSGHTPISPIQQAHTEKLYDMPLCGTGCLGSPLGSPLKGLKTHSRVLTILRDFVKKMFLWPQGKLISWENFDATGEDSFSEEVGSLFCLLSKWQQASFSSKSSIQKDVFQTGELPAEVEKKKVNAGPRERPSRS